MSYAVRANRLLAERRGTAPESGGEKSEISEKSPDAGPVNVWWAEPTLRPVPDGADGWGRAVRAAFAPVLMLPPRGCLAPVACSRLGFCDRRAAGRSCTEEEGAR